MTGDVLGTLRYMSPEQAIADRVLIDHRCDIYSLGATLYELLTLQPAFADTDLRLKLFQHIASEEPQRPRKIDEHLPVDVETIILKAMAKQRDDRYHTAEQFAEDLRAFLESRPIKARPPGLFHRAAKWSHRHQTLVTISGIAFALLFLLVTISMVVVKRLLGRSPASCAKLRGCYTRQICLSPTLLLKKADPTKQTGFSLTISRPNQARLVVGSNGTCSIRRSRSQRLLRLRATRGP